MTLRIGSLLAVCLLVAQFQRLGATSRIAHTPPADRYALQIENQRDAPLVTWIIRVGDIVITADFSVTPEPDAPGKGPVQPGEARAITLAADGPQPQAPVVVLAVFDDGGIDGRAEQVGAWTAVRRRRVDDATFWLTALEPGRDKTESDTVARLRPIVAERRRQFATRAGGQTLSFFDAAAGEGAMVERVSMLIDETLPRPAGAIVAALSTLRDDLRHRRLSMLRPLSPLSVAGSENPTAAAPLVVRLSKVGGRP